MPDIHSIEIQTEIQWFMRPYLLDFLLEAHHAFQLLRPFTLQSTSSTATAPAVSCISATTSWSVAPLC
jgi:hypothetical protein